MKNKSRNVIISINPCFKFSISVYSLFFVIIFSQVYEDPCASGLFPIWPYNFARQRRIKIWIDEWVSSILFELILRPTLYRSWIYKPGMRTEPWNLQNPSPPVRDLEIILPVTMKVV